MKPLKELALTFALVAIGIFFIRLSIVTNQVPKLIQGEGDKTRAAAVQAIDKLGDRAERRIALAQTAAVQEIRATRKQLSGDIGQLKDAAVSRLESIQADANTHGLIIEALAAKELGRAVNSWESLAAETQGVMAESRSAVKDLHPQTLGAVAAAKVFLGDSAKAARTFDARFPQILDTVQQTNESIRDTGHSIASAANIGERWLGFQLRPRTKKQQALAIIEHLGVLAIRVWLVI